MKDKEKIRAEIERRRNIINNSALQMKDVDKRNHYSEMVEEYEDILRFINSLPEEPVSEDMCEASKQYALRQVLASTDTEMTEQAYLSLKLFSGFEIAVAHKDGANWQMQQMMKDALDSTIVDDGLYKSIVPTMQAMLRYNKGDKVKLIIIKEVRI